VVPFFLEFWKKKLVEEPQTFNNSKKLRENLQKKLRLKVTLETKAIFSLTADQLNYNLNAEDKL
jgi:hypothetical protein